MSLQTLTTRNNELLNFKIFMKLRTSVLKSPNFWSHMVYMEMLMTNMDVFRC